MTIAILLSAPGRTRTRWTDPRRDDEDGVVALVCRIFDQLHLRREVSGGWSLLFTLIPISAPAFVSPACILSNHGALNFGMKTAVYLSTGFLLRAGKGGARFR